MITTASNTNSASMTKPINGSDCFGASCRPGMPAPLRRAGRPIRGAALLPGDQDEGAERDTGQHVQRGRGYSHAAVADRVAENRSVGPAVQADCPRSAAKGGQRIGV